METKKMVEFMVETVRAMDEESFYFRLKEAFKMFKPLFGKKGLDMRTVHYIEECLVDAQKAMSLLQSKRAEEKKQEMSPDIIEYYNEKVIKAKNEGMDFNSLFNDNK